MMPDKTDEFLNLYKTLEELLNAKYAKYKKRYSNSVIQFTNEDEGRMWREELTLCRDIRNLLSHHADIGGDSVIIPSDGVLNILREIVHYVENPVRAEVLMTKFNDMMVVTRGDKLSDVLTTMDEKGYSHAPVIEKDGRLFGVFSVSTVYTYLKNGGAEVLEGFTIGNFSKYLPIDMHSTETFAFIDADATYYDVKKRFNKRSPNSKRLAVLFVTASGNCKEPLLGMITPWDVIKYDD